MGFTLSDVVPWGRTFEEYCSMFALAEADLHKRILGCGDGPASFNAVASYRGYDVLSVDPLYRFPSATIEARIEESRTTIADETRRNTHEFVWSHFRTVEELIAARVSAMQTFLDDYQSEKARARYVDASLPTLPFVGRTFDLAVCSHFLFLYSEQRDLAFHVASILELCRVSSEVRIFPLLELGSRPSRHLDATIEAIRAAGSAVSRVRVPYEFQKGGNEMLQVLPPSTRPTHRIAADTNHGG